LEKNQLTESVSSGDYCKKERGYLNVEVKDSAAAHSLKSPVGISAARGKDADPKGPSREKMKGL